METIILGGGCFWCLEAIFIQLKGVQKVISGYTGGRIENPTYEIVCSGSSGHAEVVEVTFDPEVLSLHDLLTIFFTLHDPTTLNRQGADIGTQYRSAIFFTKPEQEKIAQELMQEITDQHLWPDPLVTTLESLNTFYPAEEYHQNYFKNHPEQMYCQVVIVPKVAKLRKLYTEKLVKPAQAV